MRAEGGLYSRARLRWQRQRRALLLGMTLRLSSCSVCVRKCSETRNPAPQEPRNTSCQGLQAITLRHTKVTALAHTWHASQWSSKTARRTCCRHALRTERSRFVGDCGLDSSCGSCFVLCTESSPWRCPVQDFKPTSDTRCSQLDLQCVSCLALIVAMPRNGH